MLSSTWKSWGNTVSETFVTTRWDQTPLFLFPAWKLLSASREGITETYSGFRTVIVLYGLMNSEAWTAWMERKQIQKPSKFILLCTGGEPWGKPPQWVKQQLGFRTKMRGCGRQVAAANQCLPEDWMLPKLLSLWRGRRAMSLCQRNGWEKSGKKKLLAKRQQNRWASGQDLWGRWHCWLQQLRLQIQETTGVAYSYLKIATSYWAPTTSPPLQRRESFSLGLLYFLFIILW